MMKTQQKQVILIADLGYGDAGKGSLVDYLSRSKQVHTVIRYNGGAQAAHNVVTSDRRHHTFSQFGSGSFIPGTRTHLSRFMTIHPPAMLAEERHLASLGVRGAFARTSIDRRALVTAPFQQSANRIKEIARGQGRHGSCGLGVGETMADWLTFGPDVIFAEDLRDRRVLRHKLVFLRDAKLAQLKEFIDKAGSIPALKDELDTFRDPDLIQATIDLFAYFAGLVNIVEPDHLGIILNESGTAIFEGAQGVLLDEWHGFFPYNTWSTLTFKNADTLLAECGWQDETMKLGLLRGYSTRHGAGPFVTEDSLLSKTIPDLHNGDNPWQHEFRVGHLDLLAARYALAVTGGVDGLVISHLDRMCDIPAWQTCNAYMPPAGVTDLDEFFTIQNGLATSIRRLSDPTNLEKTARLTDLLRQMRPFYTPQPRETSTYLEAISRELALPVLISSHGPTALDKVNYSLSTEQSRRPSPAYCTPATY